MNPFHWLSDSTITISATTASLATALKLMPNGRIQIRIHNGGSATVFLRKGTDSTVTAATTDLPVPSGAVEVLTLNNTDKAPITHIAAITASGTATVYITTGAGI